MTVGGLGHTATHRRDRVGDARRRPSDHGLAVDTRGDHFQALFAGRAAGPSGFGSASRQGSAGRGCEPPKPLEPRVHGLQPDVIDVGNHDALG